MSPGPPPCSDGDNNAQCACSTRVLISSETGRLNATNQPSIKTRVRFRLASWAWALRCCVDPCAASSNWHKSLMEFIHYGHQAASTAAATTKRAGNLEIGKPTMDPKGARLAFYARSRIVNSSLPLSLSQSFYLSPSLSFFSCCVFGLGLQLPRHRQTSLGCRFWFLATLRLAQSEGAKG